MFRLGDNKRKRSECVNEFLLKYPLRFVRHSLFWRLKCLLDVFLFPESVQLKLRACFSFFFSLSICSSNRLFQSCTLLAGYFSFSCHLHFVAFSHLSSSAGSFFYFFLNSRQHAAKYKRQKYKKPLLTPIIHLEKL